MISINNFKKIVLSFNGIEEKPHFNRIAYKIIKKKIFATLLEEDETANILLSIADQSVYCSIGRDSVYPVTNKFGEQGWTTFDLKIVPQEIISDALFTSYKTILLQKKRKAV
jgi:hypothetical protein